MASEVGQGKLWMDGSGKVSVQFGLDAGAGGRIITKMAVLPEDTDPERIRHFLQLLCASQGKEVPDLDEVCRRAIAAAEAARNDPGQLQELQEAQRRAAQGAKKSRKALDQRNLEMKQRAFKESVQDLIDRDMTQKQLFQLIREAIVEGVHKS